MNKKLLLNSKFLQSPFRERLVIFKEIDPADPFESIGEKEPAKLEKAGLMIDGIRDHLEVPATDEILHKSNPYLKDIVEFSNSADSKYSIDKAEFTADSIKLTYENGTQIDLPKNIFRGIMWPMITAEMDEAFKKDGNEFGKADYYRGIRNSSPNFDQVVDQAIAKISKERHIEKIPKPDAKDAVKKSVASAWISFTSSDKFKKSWMKSNDASQRNAVVQGFKTELLEMYDNNETLRLAAIRYAEECTKEGKPFLIVLSYPEKEGEIGKAGPKRTSDQRLIVTFDYKGKDVRPAIEILWKDERCIGEDKRKEMGTHDLLSEEEIAALTVKPIDGEIVTVAAAELEKAKPAGERLAKLDSETRMAGLKKSVIEAQYESEYTKAEYNSEVPFKLSADPGIDIKLDSWEMAEKGDLGKINPDKWDPRSRHGRAQMRRDWVALGIPAGEGQDPYYEAMFNQLRKCTDVSWKAAHNGVWYENPDQYINELEKNDPDFHAAWVRYGLIKNHANIQSAIRSATERKVTNLDDDPIFQKAFDAVGKNVDKFTEAFRKGDWSTVALYGVGVYALFKVFGELKDKSPFGKDSKITFGKIAMYGAAAYAGLHLAQNAGYDIPKIFHLKENFAEVNGTALAPLLTVVQEAAGEKDGKPLDANVYARVTHANLAELYDYYDSTDVYRPEGVAGFIPPEKFRQFFPQFEGKYGKELTEDAEYKHVGEQLYLTVKYLKMAFDRTLGVKHSDKELDSPYAGMSFQEALKQRHNSKVLHFTMSLYDYADLDKGYWKLQSENVDKTNAQLADILKSQKIFIDGDFEPIKGTNDLKGQIMRYPVVIRSYGKEKKFYVFPTHAHTAAVNGNIPKSAAIAEIPYDKASFNATGFKNSIEAQVKEDLKKVPNGDTLAKHLKFQNNNWEVPLTIPADPDLGIDKKIQKNVVLLPNEDGSFTFKVDGHDVNNFNAAGVSKDVAYGSDFIDRMATQGGDLSVMRVLRGELVYKGKVVGPLPAGASGTNVEFQLGKDSIVLNYDPATRKISMDPSDQKKVINNELFIDKFMEAKQNSASFNKTFEDLRVSVRAARGKALRQVGEGLLGAAKNIEWDVINNFKRTIDAFSGAIPDEYAVAVINVKQDEILNTFRGRIEKAGSFNEIMVLELELNRQLDQLSKKANDIAANRDKWSRDEIEKVINDIETVGRKSEKFGSVRDNLEKGLYELYGPGSDVLPNSHKKTAEAMALYDRGIADLDNKLLDELRYPADSRGLEWLFAKIPATATASNGFLHSGNSASPNNGDVRMPDTYTAGPSSTSKPTIHEIEVYLDGEWVDTANLYGRYAYAKYRADKILLNVRAERALNTDLLGFDAWLAQHKFDAFEPVESVDALPPLDNNTSGLKVDANGNRIEYTELEKEFKRRFEEMIDNMIKEANSSEFKAAWNGTVAIENEFQQFKDGFVGYDRANSQYIIQGSELAMSVEYVANDPNILNRSDQEKVIEEQIKEIAEFLANEDSYFMDLTGEQRLKLVKNSIF